MKVVIFLYNKFLKLLKTDANTFISYILTLITIYLCIDRLTEIVLFIFKGIGISYWGPFTYAFAFLCIIFGFLLICESSFNKYRWSKARTSKLHFLYFFSVCFVIILMSMIMQYINLIGWAFIVGLKNFPYVAKVFPELFLPAFSSIVSIIPLFLIAPLVNFFIHDLNDSADAQRSIRDFEGIKLNSSSEATGPYTCEVMMFRSTDKKKNVMIPENKRYEGALFVGNVGSGKTKTLIDPMVAFDIEKKYFFREVGKQTAFNVLSLGLATLKAPYTNTYINENFTMDMLVPVPERMSEYKKQVKKLIHYCDKENNITYKNLGITLLTNTGDSLLELSKVVENYKLKANIIDPLNPNSMGINPFAFDDPIEIGFVISQAFKTIFVNDQAETKDTMFQNISQQAIENLAILLKVMYPKQNNGKLPSLEDMLKLMNNFDLVEKMCEDMKEDPELAEKYALQISYFEKNFYRPPLTDNNSSLSFVGSGREDTQKYLYNVATELDNVLRHPGIRNVLCNRTNNINFYKMFAEGQITLCACVQGNVPFRTFAMLFVLEYQSALYIRPGGYENEGTDEDALIGNYFYIDDINLIKHFSIQGMFTTYRRCKCGLTVTAHNLAEIDQFGGPTFRETLMSNIKTKVVFGDTTAEDTEYWVKEFGTKKRWVYNLDWTPGEEDKPQKRGNAQWTEKPLFTQEKIMQQGFRQVRYKTKNAKGKTERGSGETDFLADRHKVPHDSKEFDFEKFLLAVQSNGNKAESASTTSSGSSSPIINDKQDYMDPDKEDAIFIPLEEKKSRRKKETSNK